MLLVKHIKYPDNRLRIFDHITFSTSRTRSSTYCKLSYKRSRTIKSRHFYFNRVCRLWNGLPPIDLSHSIMSIKKDVKVFLWSNFINNFNSDFPCTFHFMCPCNKSMIIPLQTNFYYVQCSCIYSFGDLFTAFRSQSLHLLWLLLFTYNYKPGIL